jgi:hypothetical protein
VKARVALATVALAACLAPVAPAAAMHSVMRSPEHTGALIPWRPWLPPYGGCKEARLFPHSRGAAECRAHGWWLVPRRTR